MMHDVDNMWQEKGIISKLRTGPGRVAFLYLVGLVGCIIAGARERTREPFRPSVPVSHDCLSVCQFLLSVTMAMTMHAVNRQDVLLLLLPLSPLN